MKAAVVTAYGGPEVMKYQEMPDPVPAAGEVLVRAAGIGINPEDLLERNGTVKGWQLQFPAIIGLDVSGTVVATGDGVTSFKPGDRVCGWVYHTYAELVAGNAAFFAPVPADMDLVDAAAVPLDGVTGTQLITVAAAVKPGQTVLVSGAAGAVGRCAVFAAKALGAHVIAGVLQRQLDQAGSIGADETTALDDPAAFAAIPPVDAVANTVRGQTATNLLAKVKRGGSFGSVTGPPRGAESYADIHVVPFVSSKDGATVAASVVAVHAGKLTIPIDRREELRNAGAGQAAFVKDGRGKVLLVP